MSAGGMTLAKDGSFVVELIHPLMDIGGEVTAVIIQPPTLDHTIRWARGDISSFLQLLNEMSGVRERTLRLLKHPDSDRVMFAFMYMMPSSISQDFQKGARPMASSDEELDLMEPAPVPDQSDGRFPHSSTVKKRFTEPPTFKSGPPLPSPGLPANPTQDPFGLDDQPTTSKVA